MLSPLYRLLRPALFRLDAEAAHRLMVGALGTAPGLWARAPLASASPDPSLARTVAGLRFAGPVGLAAGLDKDGEAIPFWPSLGFGSIEIGTVTAHSQPGNPRPRLFRLPRDRGLINRMGFNNQGSARLASRLARLRDAGRWPKVPVGVNLGKSKVTPNAEAVADYVTSARRLAGLADYFTVNVSSPNTPGLRDLQGKEALAELLPAVRAALGGSSAGEPPIFLKLSPDLSREALAEAVEIAIDTGMAGIIATNTTVTRPPGLRDDPGQLGGLSGAPLRSLARERIGWALAAAAGRVPVIGVGGIETAEHARALLDDGCAAVQIYTALVFHGPGVVERMNRALSSS